MKMNGATGRATSENETPQSNWQESIETDLKKTSTDALASIYLAHDWIKRRSCERGEEFQYYPRNAQRWFTHEDPNIHKTNPGRGPEKERLVQPHTDSLQ
jgi:hypothetical protein